MPEPTPAPYVDAHHHVWDLTRHPQSWIDPVTMGAIERSFSVDDLRPLAAAAGVSASVVVQCLHDPGETRELLALAASDPLVAGVVGWSDLQAPDVADTLAALAGAAGGSALVGLRHLVQAEPDPEWLSRPTVRRGLSALGAAGLVFDLLVTTRQLPAAVAAVAALPEVTFVLDHLASPPVGADLTAWQREIRALAALPNVVAKLSGLVTAGSWDTPADTPGSTPGETSGGTHGDTSRDTSRDTSGDKWTTSDLRPVADLALEVFGPARLMFGSDWPVCLLAADYGRVVATSDLLLQALTGTERQDVRAGTAQRVYRLPGNAAAHPDSQQGTKGAVR